MDSNSNAPTAFSQPLAAARVQEMEELVAQLMEKELKCQALKVSTGYESLNTKYMRQLSRRFPGLQGEPDQLNTTLAANGEMPMADNDDNNDEETEVTLHTVTIR